MSMDITSQILALTKLPLRRALFISVMTASNAFFNVPDAYGAYANAFKAKFNMTQTQASVLGSAISISSLVSLPASAVYEVYGVMPTFFSMSFIMTLGWSLAWIVVLLSRHLVGKPAVVWITMALAAHGRSFSMVISFAHTLTLVPPELQPILLGFIDIVGEMCVFLISFIYEEVFVGGHVKDAENQSLAGFIEFVLLISIVLNVLIAITLSLNAEQPSYNPRDTEYIEPDNVVKGSNSADNTTETHGQLSEIHEINRLEYDNINQYGSLKLPPQPADNKGYVGSIFTLHFLFLLFSLTIPAAIGYTYAFDVTYMTKSLSFEFLDYYIISFNKLFNVLGKIVACVVIACGKNWSYKYESVLLTMNLVMVSINTMVIFYPHNAIVFCVLFFSASLIQGLAGFVISLSINHFYGKTLYSVRLSIMYSLAAALSMLINVSFGSLYDSKIASGGGNYCYGMHCLTNTYILFISCSVFGILAALGLCFLKYCTLNHEPRDRP